MSKNGKDDAFRASQVREARKDFSSASNLAKRSFDGIGGSDFNLVSFGARVKSE